MTKQISPFDAAYIGQIGPLRDRRRKKFRIEDELNDDAPTVDRRRRKLKEDTTVSTRTVLELNHDFIHELRKDPRYIQKLLLMAATGELQPSKRGDIGVPGIRILAQRHHSETVELVVS